jgi:hypothetical protein
VKRRLPTYAKEKKGKNDDRREVWMKSIRDVITYENRRVVRAQNRPDLIRRDEGVLFHAAGSTGWNRRRDLGDYKKGRSEHDFRDQHDKFTEEEA